jgi:hypothetical protein
MDQRDKRFDSFRHLKAKSLLLNFVFLLLDFEALGSLQLYRD